MKSDLFFQKPSPHDKAEDDYDDDLEIVEDDDEEDDDGPDMSVDDTEELEPSKEEDTPTRSGKGKSSQIVKDKSSNESSEELDEEIPFHDRRRSSKKSTLKIKIGGRCGKRSKNAPSEDEDEEVEVYKTLFLN